LAQFKNELQIPTKQHCTMQAEQAYNDDSFYKDGDEDSDDDDKDDMDEDADADSRTDSEGDRKPFNSDSTPADTIAQEETVVVFRLKMVVLLVLVISAVGVAFTVHFYLRRSELAAFHAQYKVDSKKILQTAGSTIESVFGAFDTVAVSLVSHARATNQTWPFVTLPDFAVRMSKTVHLSRTINMNFLPLVTPTQRKDWETYAIHNDDWVNETVDVQRGFKNYYGPDEYDTMPHNILHGDFDDIPYNETYVNIPCSMI
jgi:hypothetical protein